VAPGLAKQGEEREPPASQASQASRASAPASPDGGQVLLLGPARCVRAMEVLGTALVAMRDALDARITLEVAIVRLTHPEADDDPSALLERIERLERRIQNLTAPVRHSAAASAASAAPPPPPPRRLFSHRPPPFQPLSRATRSP